MARRARSHTVAAVVAHGVAPFELAVACEVFGIDRSDLVDPWYRFVVCAAEPPPIRTSAGFTIDTPHGLDEVRRADTVIVPAWAPCDRPLPAGVADALRTAHRRGARMLSVCSGAFVLAAAGLLDGRRATTHWMHADRLAERYPSIDVDPKVLYVDEGDVLTSAGTAAGIDLCLHVVRLDHGAEVANAVARRMVVPPHRDGGQAQFVEAPVPDGGGDDSLAATLGWMLEHLDRRVTVDDLARRAHMSPRSFARRFRAATGTTPHQWLLGQRVLLASRLLETTDQPVELVARRCGMGSAASLRAHFSRLVGTSPLAYRRTFRRVDEAV
ncbi:MAG TPA: helix-turn-helix domain-containing protein [Acidimicrobiales bacterium]|nr:helix-turn-helix domain-containing protein [Acidimicrobiales bacterium]